MMPAVVDFQRWDLEDLSRRWREARPFPHVIVDDLVEPAALAAMIDAAGQEPFLPNRGEIFDFFGSEQPVQQPELQAFVEAFGSAAALAAMRAITGQEVQRVELRSYVYQPGHYLLPHLDHQSVLGRKLACAFYMLVPDDGEGGELELFEVELRGRIIVNAKPALRITPRPNRVVIFEVSDRSLHQVREILAGTRLSMAGWFY